MQILSLDADKENLFNNLELLLLVVLSIVILTTLARWC